MRKFKIVKTYKYTTEAIIEAENYITACHKVHDIDEVVNDDDWLHEFDVTEISDDK